MTIMMQSSNDDPEDRLYKLKSTLHIAVIKEPVNQNLKGDSMPFVIKRGHTTTIGRLTGFESHERRYDTLGTFDSVEAAVHAYDNDSGLLSKNGGSGSLIARPSASSLPSSPVTQDQPTVQTLPSAHPWNGFRNMSSSSSFLAPSSTLLSPATRFFLSHLLRLVINNVNFKAFASSRITFFFFTKYPTIPLLFRLLTLLTKFPGNAIEFYFHKFQYYYIDNDFIYNAM